MWDNKDTVILSTLKGEGCKCPSNLQWLKRAIEGVIHLNSMGMTAYVSRTFDKQMREYNHGLNIIVIN